MPKVSIQRIMERAEPIIAQRERDRIAEQLRLEVQAIEEAKARLRDSQRAVDFRGKVTSWNKDRGFGSVVLFRGQAAPDGSICLFFHVKSLCPCMVLDVRRDALVRVLRLTRRGLG